MSTGRSGPDGLVDHPAVQSSLAVVVCLSDEAIFQANHSGRSASRVPAGVTILALSTFGLTVSAAGSMIRPNQSAGGVDPVLRTDYDLFDLPPQPGSRRSPADARPQQGVLPPGGRDVRLSRPGLRVRLVPGRGPGGLRRPARVVPGQGLCRLRHAAWARAWTASKTSRRSACPTDRPARCSASRRSSMSSRSAGRSTRSFACSSPAACSSSPRR